MRVWRFFYMIVLLFFVVSILSVVALKYIPVYCTPLMLRRSVEAVIDGKMPVNEKRWVPIEDISRNMPLACVASEDNLFIHHNGFSKKQIKKALEERRQGKRIRGGSTISQQTAKNVFTFGTRTWARKGIEAYYTVLIEWIWGKERIMEVYLNVVELGDGIYGVGAAAEHYYNVLPAKLTKRQAALFAAALPSPRRYSISNPGPYMRRRQSQIVDLMGKVRYLD